ncbi:MAG: YqiA/YcfP family alpha/beta fold hydrolase [Bryobacteraceae bacterium]
MNVIYLHGFGSGPASKKAKFFKKQFRTKGIEMSIPQLVEGPFEAMTLTAQLAVVERELARLGRSTLIGSSMGGYLAALMAARDFRVDRVVCLAPAFDFAARWAARIGAEAMKEWQHSGWLPVHNYAEDREARVGWQLYQDSLAYQAYPAVPQPALVIHGRKDDVVPLEVSEEFARRNASAKLVAVDSGHELTDVLDLLWERTWRFLSR